MRVRARPSPEEAERLAKTYITIFCDASHCPRTLAYGWAFWAKFGHPAELHKNSGGGVGLANATAAEYLGCEEAIKWVKTQSLTDKIIVLQCDNLDACSRINLVMKDLKKLGAKDAYAKHVKGHREGHSSRHYMNGVVDRMARTQMELYR